jgi:hypothetical protein
LLLLDAVPKASAKKQVGGGKKEIETGGRGWRGGPISSGAATERTAPINPVQMLLLERTVSVGSSCVAGLRFLDALSLSATTPARGPRQQLPAFTGRTDTERPIVGSK